MAAEYLEQHADLQIGNIYTNPLFLKTKWQRGNYMAVVTLLYCFILFQLMISIESEVGFSR